MLKIFPSPVKDWFSKVKLSTRHPSTCFCISVLGNLQDGFLCLVPPFQLHVLMMWDKRSLSFNHPLLLSSQAKIFLAWWHSNSTVESGKLFLPSPLKLTNKSGGLDLQFFACPGNLVASEVDIPHEHSVMKSLLRLVARWWMPWWFLVSMTGLWIPTRKDSLTALQDEEQSPVIFITSYLPRWTWHGHNLQAYKPWAFPNWPDLWSQGPLFSPVSQSLGLMAWLKLVY